MKSVSIVGMLTVLAASALSGLLGYGTYGYLREKKRWSSWKAGAATGAIGGVLGIAAIMFLGSDLQQGAASLFPSSSSVGALMQMPLTRVRLNTIPRIVNASVGQAISVGCPSCVRAA